MSPIVIVGYFDVSPEDVPAAAELMRTMMNETIKEHGCERYVFSADLSNPNRFHLSEVWENQAALDGHFRSAHMAAFRAGLGNVHIQARVLNKYDVTNADRM